MSQHLITTHNESGQAIFSSQVPSEPHALAPPGANATLQILYSANTTIPNLSSEDDIATYSQHRTNGIPPGNIIPSNGFGALQFTLGPGYVCPMHRTMTLDLIYVLQGEVELHLDSGEMKVIKQGDSVVQRGTNHWWKNITKDGGEAKFIGFAVPCQEPIKIGEKELGPEGLH